MTAEFPSFFPDGHDADAHARPAIRAWKRRSKLIHLFRRWLPAAIGLVVLLIIGFVIVPPLLSEFRPPDQAAPTIRMVNPRYYGRDEEGRAYELAAKEAARDPRRRERITLTAPEIVTDSRGDRPVHVAARQGLYTETDRILVLRDGVVLTDRRGGARFDTARARIDTNTSVITGDSRVRGVGPQGSIEGGSFAIYDQGQRIVFRGGVRGRLVNSGGNRLGAPAGAGEGRDTQATPSPPKVSPGGA